MTVPEIIQKLISDRKLDLNPPHPSQITWSDLNIEAAAVNTAIKLIRSHIDSGHKIAIYGDYDVDGICSTAILWQTIYSYYPHVFPHIPDRRKEGYGLSKEGIDHCISQGAKLVITVDSGIVAIDQIAYARSLGLDVVVVDHHEVGDKLPDANCIIHSLSTSAAGLSYFFSREITQKLSPSLEMRRGARGEVVKEQVNYLDLTALAVICDLVPLTGINRSIAKYGLEELNITSRPGLLALYEIAGIKQVTAYHAGFIIGPRLNATGRLTHAMDSLRLLCTNSPEKAQELAKSLNETNLKRQQLTEDLTLNAINQVIKNQVTDIIIVADPSYDEGIIGLIAARLVEKYYRPAIAISVGKDVCKASARSILGFHITDFLRLHSDLFLGVGGHSMAAGFSFDPKNLQSVICDLSSEKISPDLLVKKEKFDMELSLEFVSWDLWVAISDLQPFGLGNPTPVFLAKNVEIYDPKIIGKTGKHLKFTASQNGASLPCVWFNPPSLELPKKAKIYYQIDADSYKGPGNIQLIIKKLVLPSYGEQSEKRAEGS